MICHNELNFERKVAASSLAISYWISWSVMPTAAASVARQPVWAVHEQVAPASAGGMSLTVT